MSRFSGVDPGLEAILTQAKREELDYGFILSCLQNYAAPRAKLSQLLRARALIRVKKGIYVIGKPFAKHPYSLEVLANMIYGPSYVSLEWACQHYRLIPERVSTVTSITMGRKKRFTTPVGLFTYDHMGAPLFSVGVTQVTFSDTQQALFATREKALTDLLVMRRGAFHSKAHFKEVLFDDLRVEEEDVRRLDRELLGEIGLAKPHSAIRYLLEVVNE